MSPVPDEPLPHANERDAFLERVTGGALDTLHAWRERQTAGRRLSAPPTRRAPARRTASAPPAVARAAASSMRVSVCSVGERRDVFIGDDPVEQLAVEVRDPVRAALERGERHERGGRALQHLAADDRADRDDRRVGAPSAPRGSPARRGSARSRRAGWTGRSRSRARRRSRASTCSLGRACSAPRNSRPSIGPAARSRIMNSWKAHQPAAPVRTQRAHRVIAHRQHPRAYADRARSAARARPSA